MRTAPIAPKTSRPRASQGNGNVNSGKSAKPTKKKKAEMPIVFTVDSDVHIHPSLIEKLAEMGITTKAAPPKNTNKVLISIRLDPDIVAALKTLGEGREHKNWQPNTNDFLREVLTKRGML